MLGSKLNIFKNEWLDVVFAGRNKAYGAYVLRKVGPAMTAKALLIGVIIFVLGISTPLIVKFLDKGDANAPTEKFIETEVVLSEPPPVDEATPPPPPPVEPPPPRVDQVRMPPPVVVEASKVRDEEPPTVEELRKADPGPKTIEGDPTADIRIDLPVGEGPKDQEVTESVGANHIFEAVEVQPQPPGGMAAFLKYIGSTYQYPAQAEAQGVSGRVILTFVVERDGSLTDIKIVRDLKYGTGEEAVRVLKRAQKWSPGVQNGRPVRVQFTLPIVLNLANQ
jgi:protein TonB